jgi:Mn-dependent DtxR family transcriptional regulator
VPLDPHEKKQFEILSSIYLKNQNIAPTQRPDISLAFEVTGGEKAPLVRSLYVAGFIGQDIDGQLAITDDGRELLKSMIRRNRERESTGEDQTPPDRGP